MTAAAHRFDNGLRYRDEGDPRQVHLTPDYILDPVRRVLGDIYLDPCTEPDNPTGATHFYAPPVDGAAMPWELGPVFCNPPYGKARERWVRRCIEEGATGESVVLLIPAHPDTRIFQEALATATSVLFIRGRVKFGVLRPNRRQAAASHPSALIGWNVDLREIRDLGFAVLLRGLDVDGLARAMSITDPDDDGNAPREPNAHDAYFFRKAVRIADEYARLATPASQEAPE